MTGPKFAILPARAVYDENLGHAEMRVLAALGTYADVNGSCWPSIRTLAKRLGHKNRRTTQRHIRKLQELGYITSNNQFGDRGEQVASQFHIPDLNRPEGGWQSTPPGGGRGDHGGDGQDSARGGGRGDHPNVPIERTNRTLAQKDSIAPLPGAPDPAAIVFQNEPGGCLHYLIQRGTPEKKARTVLGRWRSKFGDGAVIDAVSIAMRNSASEPVGYVSKILKNREGAAQHGDYQGPYSPEFPIN